MAEPAVNQLADRIPNLEVRWRAFELRPESVPPLNPDDKYITMVWEKSVFPLAQKMGMALKIPPVQPRTRLAHEAAKSATAQGRFADYHSGIFRSFLHDGRDIGRIDVLVDIASQLQLDPDILKRSLKRGQYSSEVLADTSDARTLDINAVPAYLVNGKIFATGFLPTHTLQKQLNQMLKQLTD
ncbi:DsbA family protein [Thermodesulfobacteriota bacterium]